MMNRREFLRRTMYLSTGAAALSCAPGGTGVSPVRGAEHGQDARATPTPAAGPLRVHRANPRYFDDGSGKAVYLTGSHLGWELQDDSWGREHVFDYPRFLDFLVSHNHNLMRMWVVEHTRCERGNPRAVATPMPYLRTGPGTALDGGPKFDLTRFNPEYFRRLRERVAAAGRRGIYVIVMLLQGFSVHTYRGRNPWFGHPMNRQNNTGGIDGDANGDGDGREVHTLANPAITALQEAYVRKVIDTVGDLDSVLYEIANEAGVYSTDWQYRMIRFIKRYESTRPKQHPVGMTVQIPGGHRNNAVLFEGPADWISPNREGGYGTDPPPADGRKVIISDTDHHGAKPYPQRRAWVWKSLFRGHHPIFLDMYPDQETRQLDRIDTPELDPQWEPIRRAMGLARALADRVDLTRLTPHSELASSAYCLADPGRTYLAYLPEGGKVRLDLSAAPGRLSVTWLEARTKKSAPAGSIEGGAGREFAAPTAGDKILHVSK
jgi:hypothetical protein